MPQFRPVRSLPATVTGRILAGWVCALTLCYGCPADDSGSSIEEKAKQVDVDLPPAGVGPLKQFRTLASENGSAPRQVVTFEWPDGTEEIEGRTYNRTRITVVESGRKPTAEFRYSRSEDGKRMAIENARRDFGEYYAGPANLKVGDEWHSRDSSESSDCRVEGYSRLLGVNYNFDKCLQVNCETQTTMPDGVVFKGKTISHSCGELGFITMTSESSNGDVTIKISTSLERYSWNDVEP